jgi:hypothetical protein
MSSTSDNAAAAAAPTKIAAQETPDAPALTTEVLSSSLSAYSVEVLCLNLRQCQDARRRRLTSQLMGVVPCHGQVHASAME